MEHRIAKYRDIIKTSLESVKDELSSDLYEQAMKDVDDASTPMIDIIYFALANFQIDKKEPLSIGRNIPNHTESFRKITEKLNSDDVLDTHKRIFTNRLIRCVNQVLDDADPELLTIPSDYFLDDSESYEEYVKEHKIKMNEYSESLSDATVTFHTDDYVSRLRKILDIARM